MTEFLRWYCRGFLSSRATDIRRLSDLDNLGDRYTFFPEVCLVEKCLDEKNVVDFFSRDEIVSMGLNKKGFDEFIERMEESGNYKMEGFLEL